MSIQYELNCFTEHFVFLHKKQFHKATFLPSNSETLESSLCCVRTKHKQIDKKNPDNEVVRIQGNLSILATIKNNGTLEQSQENKMYVRQFLP